MDSGAATDREAQRQQEDRSASPATRPATPDPAEAGRASPTSGGKRERAADPQGRVAPARTPRAASVATVDAAKARGREVLARYKARVAAAAAARKKALGEARAASQAPEPRSIAAEAAVQQEAGERPPGALAAERAAEEAPEEGAPEEEAPEEGAPEEEAPEEGAPEEGAPEEEAPEEGAPEEEAPEEEAPEEEAPEEGAPEEGAPEEAAPEEAAPWPASAVVSGDETFEYTSMLQGWQYCPRTAEWWEGPGHFSDLWGVARAALPLPPRDSAHPEGSARGAAFEAGFEHGLALRRGLAVRPPRHPSPALEASYWAGLAEAKCYQEDPAGVLEWQLGWAGEDEDEHRERRVSGLGASTPLDWPSSDEEDEEEEEQEEGDPDSSGYLCSEYSGASDEDPSGYSEGEEAEEGEVAVGGGSGTRQLNLMAGLRAAAAAGRNAAAAAEERAAAAEGRAAAAEAALRQSVLRMNNTKAAMAGTLAAKQRELEKVHVDKLRTEVELVRVCRQAGMLPPVILDVESRLAIGARIGGGGCGECFTATLEGLTGPYQVVVKTARRGSEQLLAAEIGFALRARGPLAVCVFGEATAAGGRLAMIMETMVGDLGDVLRCGITLAQAIGMILNTALFLEKCRRSGIVHLDIKPGNMLVDSNRLLKGADFGLALALGGAQFVPTTARGTWPYIAPELFALGVAQPASDIYSLGVMVLRDILPAVGLSAVPCLACLEKAVVQELEALAQRCCVQLPTSRPSALQVAAIMNAMMRRATGSEMLPQAEWAKWLA